MEFNKIIRGHNRSANNEDSLYEVLDSGFLCHVAFQHEGQTMIIPTSYGRDGNTLLLHGSTKNFMLNQIANGHTICISVTHLDGIVLARTMIDTSANYRSAILYGKAEIVLDDEERRKAMHIVSDHIIKGRWAEVDMGPEKIFKATLVLRFTIENASVKIRSGGPEGDEDKTNVIWSGHIPLSLKAGEPVEDMKFGVKNELTKSVKNYLEMHK